ncbi:hypothetical protein ABEV13_13470, partial [Geobacillus stearothermophilus]
LVMNQKYVIKGDVCMLKKLFCGVLAGVIAFSSFSMLGNTSAKAASNLPPSPVVQKEKSETTYSPSSLSAQSSIESEVQPYGAKGFMVKLAIQTIKVAIDKGGSVLNYIIKWFDKDTASYFTKNKSKVIKALNQLEDWIDDASDLTQSTIKTKLNSLLRSAGVPSTYSLSIADAIARTITWLIL